MANFYATSRTEEFRVRDVQALRDDLAAWGITDDIEIVEVPRAEPGTIYLLARTHNGEWPSFEDTWVADRLDLYPDTREDDHDVEGALAHLPHHDDVEDIWDLVGKHLVEGEVAIFKSVGNEKLRYVAGYAVAINAHGESHTICLDDIHEYARRLATTPAEP